MDFAAGFHFSYLQQLWWQVGTGTSRPQQVLYVCGGVSWPGVEEARRMPQEAGIPVGRVGEGRSSRNLGIDAGHAKSERNIAEDILRVRHERETQRGSLPDERVRGQG